jgi:hypothetical protein
MFQSARKQMRAIATLGVAAALVVGGVAAAQGGSAGSQGSGHPAGPPPFGGPMMLGKNLTYAELHVQTNGKEETIRLDQGKITAVDDSSITLAENDGSSVTIPVDANTKVLGRPGEESTLGDLSAGQQVSVCGPDGGTAKAIMVAPKKGEMKGAPLGGPGGSPPPAPRLPAATNEKLGR